MNTTEQKCLNNYLNSMTKLQRGKTEKILSQKFIYENGIFTRAEYIEQCVASCAIFGKHAEINGRTTYSIENPNRSYLPITKTEWDYAMYLGASRVPESVFENEKLRVRKNQLCAKYYYPSLERLTREIERWEKTPFNPYCDEGKKIQARINELKELKSLKEKLG